MKKNILICLLLGFISLNLAAEDESELTGYKMAHKKWRKSLTLSVIFNQSKSAYTGYDGSLVLKETLSLGTLINGRLIRDTVKTNWKNTLKIKYESLRTYDESSVFDSKDWIEDYDQLLLDSVCRWKLAKFFNLYLAVNMETAMVDTDYLNEWKAFTPIQFRDSGGLSVPVISNDKQELIGRSGFYIQHYIINPDKYESFNGIEGVVEYKNQINNASLLTSKLGFYSTSWEEEDAYGNTEDFSTIEMEWHNTFTTKLTKFVSININYNLFNEDVTDNEVNYEWEQKIYLAFYCDIF